METPEPRQGKDRHEAVRRYLELRPIVRARLAATVPADVHKECGSITAHQLRALLLLPDDGLSMRQLALALGVMGATVSVLADRLVAQGLAVRRPDPRDRRVVRLAPSERGHALAARASARERRSAREIFDRLSEAQVVAFLDVLETLAARAPETPEYPARGGSSRGIPTQVTRGARGSSPSRTRRDRSDVESS
ncbi:MAG: MarR family transcriptional regulator [Acidimicrobiales bacterium]